MYLRLVNLAFHYDLTNRFVAQGSNMNKLSIVV